ncbi:hypothetical protein [Fusobacterium sp.]|uniref:translocation/assembly module TamB domain-containing protein n=1 Tax=Fusobacterium sp. TaxID=68766 RepID=UPI0026268575|nr:hypothetical protein [Fusobacterium sp.]
MKTNIFNKKVKILLIFLPLFFIVYLVYLALFQLNTLVSLGIGIFTHGTMKIERIEFEKGSGLKEGKIEILNSKLFDKKLLIADTPKITIEYKDWKIENINIYSPKAVLVRKNSEINFVTVFVGKSSDDDKKEEKKENKSSPILKRINVYDADLKFVDKSYSAEISREVENVNGYVAFYDGYKIDLKFLGEKEDEKYSFAFNTLEKSYDMKIELSNINACDTLVQYGYDSKGELNNVTGVMNLDLRINDDGFFGQGKFTDGKISYNDLGVPIEDITLDLQFLGKQIVIDGNYLFFKKRGSFFVEYNDGKGVDVILKLKDILFSEAKNYKILQDSGVNLEDFNIDDVNIHLSVRDNFKAQVDLKSANGFKQDVVSLKDISAQLIYEDGEIRVNNIHTSLAFDKDGEKKEREITGNVVYKGDTGRVKLNAKGKEGFLSNVNLNFLFITGKDKFKFKLDSDILNMEGRYEYKKNMLFVNQNKNFELKYNIKDKKLEQLRGYLDVNLDDYLIRTNLNAKNEYEINIDSTISDKKENKEEDKKDENINGNLKGFVNLKNMTYDFKVKVKDINISEKFGNIFGSLEGYVKGENGRLDGEILLDNIGVELKEQKLRVADILGVVTLKKDDKLSVIYQGEVGKVKVDTVEINGFKVSAKYSDDNLNILNVSNKFLTLNGNYSIINSKLDLFVKGVDINKDVVKLGEINYEIPLIDGHIFGSLDDLTGKITIKDGSVDLGEDRFISFNGDINYLKNKVYADDFKINQNKLSFEYFLDKKIGNYHVDIFESLLSEFVSGGKLRVIGVTSGTINEENKIDGEFEGSVNEIYLKGNKIPNIYFSGNYNNDLVNFKELNILSLDDDKNVLKTNGVINIKDKFLSFSIPKQLVYPKYLLEKEGVDGDISVEGKVEGLFENIEYYLKASDGKLSYNGTVLHKIGLDLSGNKEKLVLNNFTASYFNNSIKSDGEYDILENKYKFNLVSSDIDLSFLTAFLKPYDVDKVSGKGKLNLVFTEMIPEGEIKLNNFEIGSKKYGVDLNNLNGNFVFDKGILRIKKFSGILNDGSINIKGYLDAERTVNHLLDENFDEIDYNLVLDGRGVKYAYEDYFNINFNTRLSFQNNMIFGNITINEGKVNKILEKDFGIVTIVKNFIKDFFNKNKAEKIFMENTKSFSGNNKGNSDLKINIGFNIDKGIEIDVKKITSFLTNIEGTVFGQGKLTGSLGKLNFLGENSIKDGEFILNGNKFTIDRAIVLFNDRNSYIPDINPNITFTTSSIINNKNLEISLDGPLDRLTFTVRSGNEVSVNSLDSVLSGDGIGEGNSDISILLTNIIGGQITDVVLGPIVDVLRAVGFSNLRVRSSILAEQKKKEATDESTMSFGAFIEAESPIYKDKLFWKVKANFMNDPTNKDGAENSNNYNYGVADYDINMYYRINKNVSWGVGVQKLREDLDTEGSNMNYYTELKFEKKFDF